MFPNQPAEKDILGLLEWGEGRGFEVRAIVEDFVSMVIPERDLIPSSYQKILERLLNVFNTKNDIGYLSKNEATVLRELIEGLDNEKVDFSPESKSFVEVVTGEIYTPPSAKRYFIEVVRSEFEKGKPPIIAKLPHTKKLGAARKEGLRGRLRIKSSRGDGVTP